MSESFPLPERPKKIETKVEEAPPEALLGRLHSLAERVRKPEATWKDLESIWRNADKNARADMDFSKEDVRLIQIMAMEDKQSS